MESEILNLTYNIRYTTYETKSTKYYVRIYQKKMQNKPNSPNVQIDLTSFTIMIYTIFISLTKVKNKPNQTQFKPKTNPISEKPKMSVNIYYKREYDKKTALWWIKNKPNQTQNKANFKPCPERSRMGQLLAPFFRLPSTLRGPTLHHLPSQFEPGGQPNHRFIVRHHSGSDFPAVRGRQTRPARCFLCQLSPDSRKAPALSHTHGGRTPAPHPPAGAAQ